MAQKLQFGAVHAKGALGQCNRFRPACGRRFIVKFDTDEEGQFAVRELDARKRKSFRRKGTQKLVQQPAHAAAAADFSNDTSSAESDQDDDQPSEEEEAAEETPAVPTDAAPAP